MRMGPGGLLQNAEGTAGAETEAKEGVLRAGRGATCGSGPAVGGGEQDLPRSTGTSSLHHSSRLGLSSSRRMQTDVVCKWGSPMHQVCAVAKHGPAGQSLGRGGDGSAPLQEASVTAHPHTLRWRHEWGAGGTSPVTVCPGSPAPRLISQRHVTQSANGHTTHAAFRHSLTSFLVLYW